MASSSTRSPVRDRIHEIIFEAETPAGKAFDILLLVMILLSVITVMLESIDRLSTRYGEVFLILEWIFTIIFTIEYLLRLYCVSYPRTYALSFFGVIDLLAILPTYLSMLVSGTQYFVVIRAIRLLRIFRIFKLGHFLSEGYLIMDALRASRAKIIVFLSFISILTIIIGAVMYLIEGAVNESFSSIPRAVYWAVVTLTTVGYGDITPTTDFGQFVSAVVMILGYAIIAVPTGIVTNEIMVAARSKKTKTTTKACRFCGQEGHDQDAAFCKYCGNTLNE